ncbi:Cleft lip and palate transmembrane protein 1 [Ophiocordyceps sinensis CO18]|uniref:Cleft lip and palate transmembrane protein 1 n=1 Tax=Ophiocordyceps sinensis (strain Co18 / CGMCC 3.14243) TaxID=911162 RepID=T5A8M5_OPHSC|nr:Cleft lip and palate transmembrane protein 1 [Ophiocordyceps sinensis CO18]
MPSSSAVVVADQPQQQPQGQQTAGFSLKKLALGAAVYFGINYGLSYMSQKSKKGTVVTNPETGEPVTVAANMQGIPPFQLRPKTLNEGAQRRLVPKKIAPIWAQDSHVDIVVTLSPSFNPIPISQTPAEYVVLQEKNFHVNNKSDTRSIDTTFTVPRSVQNNGTLWGHFYIGLTGSVVDPKEPGFDPATAYHFTYPLTQYLARKKVAKKRNLLENRSDSATEKPEESASTGPIISSPYHPNSSFAFVPAMGVQDLSQLHPAMKQFLRLEATGARDGTGENGWYYPLVFVNTFWQLTNHMTVLNDTVKELPLHIDLKNMAFWQFQILASIESNSKENARQAAFGASLPGGGDGTEIEMVKEIFIDTNPILLGITAVVTVAHLILETLAFGSDIAHYRKKKDNIGISVRSILANVLMQTIIFLYLLDNSQNTSWMILGTQVVGIVIEFWKVTTVVNVRVRAAAAGSLLPYRLVLEDKHQLTETEEKTKQYDEIAFRYMYMAAVPLLTGYGIYSLFYETHKSWYSFTITTLVGSVYTYGFLMMVPSLYINYRLKSVAHMPAKAMMYKFLNTFIDDLFAFTVKMPILHRLATLRDDVIFFVYIYQRWAYKIDHTRVNEFGQGGEDTEDAGTEDTGTAATGALKAKEVEKAEAKESAAEAAQKAEGKATGRDARQATKRR